jgi:catechol 2,3-dioxygenase-like lactoylglutathione lyase family enzyme
MKIAAVRLFVDDVAAARSFYADLLALPPVLLEPAVLVFDAGPLLIVEQADAEARAEGLVGRFAGVSLGVSDIEALHARLKASGCTIVGPPEGQSWGGTLMHVKDPGGNIVSFVQN